MVNDKLEKHQSESGRIRSYYEKLLFKLFNTHSLNLSTSVRFTAFWALTALLALLLYQCIKNTNFQLENFDGRIIGTVALDGIDVGKRNVLVLIGLFFAAISGIFLAIVFSKSPKASKEFPHKEEEGLTLLSSILAILSVATMISTALNLANLGFSGLIQSLITKSWITCLFFWILFLIWPSKISKALKFKHFHLSLGAFSAFALISSLRLLKYNEVPFMPWDGAIICFTAIAGGTALHRIELSYPKVYFLLKAIVLLICFQPLIFVLSNEAKYIANLRNFDVRLDSLHSALILFSIIISWWLARKRVENERLLKIVSVLALWNLAVFIDYNWYTDFHYGDNFHSSESLMPALEFAKFGKLPWLDILPTHGFADRPFAYLHTLISGSKNLEIMAWEWVPTVVLKALLMICLSNFIGLLPVSVMAIMFPMVGHETFFPLMGATWLLVRQSTLSKTKVIRVFSCLLILLLYFYYPSFGVPLVTAGIILVALIRFYITEKFSPVIKEGLLAITLFVILIGSVVLIYKGEFSVVGQWIEFIRIQGQSMSTSRFVNDHTEHVVIIYLLQPLAYITLAFITFIRVWKNRHRGISEGLVFVLFVSIVVLVNFIHSFQRHSLSESYNLAYVWLIPTLIGIQFVCWDQFNFLNKTPLFKKLAILNPTRAVLLFAFLISTLGINYSYRIPETFSYKNPTKKMLLEKRVDGTTDTPNELAEFFKNNLKDFQTFYDLSNTPAAYVASGAKFPTFIIPSLYHTSENTQLQVLKDLKKLKAKGGLPYVLYSRPKSLDLWNKIDMVPNTVRSFMVAEFVHQNYFPCESPMGYSVWCENEVSKFRKTDYSNFDSKDLRYLPSIWAKSSGYDEIILSEFTHGSSFQYLNIPTVESRAGVSLDIRGCNWGDEIVEVIGVRKNGNTLPMFNFKMPNCGHEVIRKLSVADIVTINRSLNIESAIATLRASLKETNGELTNSEYNFVLTPTSWCTPLDQSSLLSRKNPNIRIVKTRDSIGCVALNAYVDHDINIEDKDVSKPNPSVYISPIWSIEEVSATIKKYSHNNIRLGMSPVWFDEALTGISLEVRGKQIINRVRFIKEN